MPDQIARDKYHEFVSVTDDGEFGAAGIDGSGASTPPSVTSATPPHGLDDMSFNDAVEEAETGEPFD